MRFGKDLLIQIEKAVNSSEKRLEFIERTRLENQDKDLNFLIPYYHKTIDFAQIGIETIGKEKELQEYTSRLNKVIKTSKEFLLNFN